jgi:hypothetical protein
MAAVWLGPYVAEGVLLGVGDEEATVGMTVAVGEGVQAALIATTTNAAVAARTLRGWVMCLSSGAHRESSGGTAIPEPEGGSVR